MQEGKTVNDRAVELLEQYDIEVLRTRKGRGAIVCDTENGSYILKEYAGGEERLRLQNELLGVIAANGRIRTEQIIPTKEGALSVRDGDQTAYILKTWQDGRECNVNDRSECIQAVRILAELHHCMVLPAEATGDFPVFRPEKEYEKHNREIRKVRKYLKQKGQKQRFEMNLLNACDYFLEQAVGVTQEWLAYRESFDKKAADTQSDVRVLMCHGDYQYHNILMGAQGWFIVNFERCLPDDPIRDLYLLMRKLSEKGNWAVTTGQELLRSYERVRQISAESQIDLYYRLSYPEKFWKIVNFYYNSRKSWIPGKNEEKLEKLIVQEKEKQRFLDIVFRDVCSC